MSLEIRLFGPLQVADSGREFSSRLAPRAKRLLAYLLLNRSKPLPREAVAFALWPDTTEEEALGNLRRALNELRAGLPQGQMERVLAARGQIVWNADLPYWLDVEEFERLVRRETAGSLHEAIDLYTGDLLPDLDDEWLIVERERLRQLHLNALLQLVLHYRALGQYPAALDLARRILVLDPLSESTYRELIALQYLNGDRSAALALYQQLRGVLRQELGADPMAETRTLVEAIVRGNPLSASSKALAVSAWAPSVPPLPRPLGRESEMSELGMLWESAASGHGRLAIISGEAGIGKTHLAVSLAEYASHRGALALLGHCYEFENALPYESIVEMLRSRQDQIRPLELAQQGREEPN